MSCHKIYYRNVDVDHLYIARSNDDKGLNQLRFIKTTTIGLKIYLEITSNWILQLSNE